MILGSPSASHRTPAASLPHQSELDGGSVAMPQSVQMQVRGRGGKHSPPRERLFGRRCSGRAGTVRTQLEDGHKVQQFDRPRLQWQGLVQQRRGGRATRLSHAE